MKYRWLKVISIHNNSFNFKYESHHVCRCLQVRCKKRSWTRSIFLVYYRECYKVSTVQRILLDNLDDCYYSGKHVNGHPYTVYSFYLILDRYSLHNYSKILNICTYYIHMYMYTCTVTWIVYNREPWIFNQWKSYWIWISTQKNK